MTFIEKVRMALFGKDVLFKFRVAEDDELRVGRLFKSKRWSEGYAIHHSEGTTSVNNFRFIQFL